MIGGMVGHYRIEDRLGAGGMGVVYRAFDTRLERDVAIKVLGEKWAGDEAAQARMLREARTASALNHPHICTIHEVGEAEGQVYIVMEYIEGEPLNRLIPAGGFAVESVVRYGSQVAGALAHAHERGIIHRDLKTANVMVTREGRVKVLDFGLAKRIPAAGPASGASPTQSLGLTQEGMVVGTLHYMAPEVLRGVAADVRSDIWALGIVLYELAAGALPFQGHTGFEVSSLILKDPPAPLPIGCPPALGVLIQKCLSKDPAQRYQRASEVLAVLEAVQSNTSVIRTPSVPAAAENSVAVLDFVNITGDPAADWLSTGIAETVTVDLKKISSLKVVSREKIQKALGNTPPSKVAEEDIRRLASAFGMRWVVWGGYQKVGNSIRITPRFTEAASGDLLGSAKIDGSMDDIFRLQDKIITHLLETVSLEVTGSEIQKIEKPETRKLQAYEWYAKGRQLFNLFGKTSFEEAQELFEKAIEIDPDYALAYSGLGSICIFKFISHTDPRDLDIGIGHLQKAQQLDPDLAEPYPWLTYAYMRKSLFSEAIAAGSKAVQLEPENTQARYFLGCAYLVQGAMQYDRSAFQAAVELFQATIRFQPDYEPPYMNLAWIYMMHADYSSAQHMLEKAIAIEESGSFQDVRFIGALTLMGNLCLRRKQPDNAAEWYQRSLKVLERVDHVYREAFIALTYCGFGEVGFQSSQHRDALEHYQSARALISRFPKALGIGYYMVRALLGLARVFHRLGRPQEAKDHFEQASQLVQKKEGLDFHWIWEGSDATMHYQMAAYFVVAGERDSALASLRKAAQCGWADAYAIESDISFDSLREDAEFQSLMNELRSSKMK